MADALAAYECSFEYEFLAVNDLRVKTVINPKNGRAVATQVFVKDEPLTPTRRFWTSLTSLFSFSDSIFDLFTHAETFERISQVRRGDRIRLCIERNAAGEGTLLAASNPKKPIVVYDELMDLVTKYEGENVNYHGGMVESTHKPRVVQPFDVSGDRFVNRFLMSTPIDGYGKPSIYLSLLREVCSNGLIGYTKTFKSQVPLGKVDDDVTPSLSRGLDGFSSDEGYVAIRQRIESSQSSWCSVYEAGLLYALLVKLHHRKAIENFNGVIPAQAKNVAKLLGGATAAISEQGESNTSPLLRAFHSMTGDTSRIYGLANLDALSVKRRRTLPVRCKVYDLINFATEVATHYATPEGARTLQGWLGQLVDDEYDMEGTADKFTDFADFHVTQHGDAASLAV